MSPLKILSTPADVARVCVTFDDGWLTAYSEGYTYAISKGVKGTCYIITDNIGTEGYMSAEQLQAMYAAGWDIGNHTKSHQYFQTDSLSQAQIQAQVGDAAVALDALGFTRSSKHVAYPGGQNPLPATYNAMVASGMLTGRTVVATSDLLPSICQRYATPCKIIGDPTDLDTAKGYVDAVLSSKKTLILGFHQIVTPQTNSNQWTVENYQSLIDYIVVQDVQTVTISELHQVVELS